MPRSKYSRGKGKAIPINLKMRLIESVFENHKSVHQTAIQMNLKYSTAKAIVKRYRQSNTIERRNSRRSTPSEDNVELQQQMEENQSQPGNQSQVPDIEPLVPEINFPLVQENYQFPEPVFYPENYPFYPYFQNLCFWQMM